VLISNFFFLFLLETGETSGGKTFLEKSFSPKPPFQKIFAIGEKWCFRANCCNTWMYYNFPLPKVLERWGFGGRKLFTKKFSSPNKQE
jgi:hypothetical protein